MIIKDTTDYNRKTLLYHEGTCIRISCFSWKTEKSAIVKSL